MKDMRTIEDMKFYLSGRLEQCRKEKEELDAKPERLQEICAYRKATNEGMLFELESMLNFIEHLENR